MVQKLTYKKIKLRIRMFWVLNVLRKTWVYYFLYKSYWNSLKKSKSNSKNIVSKNLAFEITDNARNSSSLPSGKRYRSYKICQTM